MEEVGSGPFFRPLEMHLILSRQTIPAFSASHSLSSRRCSWAESGHFLGSFAQSNQHQVVSTEEMLTVPSAPTPPPPRRAPGYPEGELPPELSPKPWQPPFHCLHLTLGFGYVLTLSPSGGGKAGGEVEGT